MHIENHCLLLVRKKDSATSDSAQTTWGARAVCRCWTCWMFRARECWEKCTSREALILFAMSLMSLWKDNYVAHWKNVTNVSFEKTIRKSASCGPARYLAKNANWLLQGCLNHLATKRKDKIVRGISHLSKSCHLDCQRHQPPVQACTWISVCQLCWFTWRFLNTYGFQFLCCHSPGLQLPLRLHVWL